MYDDLCAPAVAVLGDTMILFGSTYTSDFPIWMSTNPKGNEWKEAIDSLYIGGWDPDFFVDDDGLSSALSVGTSNILGIETDFDQGFDNVEIDDNVEVCA